MAVIVCTADVAGFGRILILRYCTCIQLLRKDRPQLPVSGRMESCQRECTRCLQPFRAVCLLQPEHRIDRIVCLLANLHTLENALYRYRGARSDLLCFVKHLRIVPFRCTELLGEILLMGGIVIGHVGCEARVGGNAHITGVNLYGALHGTDVHML